MSADTSHQMDLQPQARAKFRISACLADSHFLQARKKADAQETQLELATIIIGV